MKKIFFFLIILLFPLTAFAAEFKTGESLFINDPADGDAYIAAGEINLNSPVSGDLFAAGGEVHIDSAVSEDVTAAGGKVSISGQIGGDLRTGGGDVMIDAGIAEDCFAGGGNITITKDAVIGGDLFFGGGSLVLDGKVEGDVIGSGGTVYIKGKVMGNVKLYNVDNLRMSPDARIQGDLFYKSPVQSITKETASVGGQIDYKERGKKEPPMKEALMSRILAGFSFFSLLTGLIFGMIIFWLFRFYAMNAVKQAYKTPLKNLGIGFLIAVFTPVAILIMLLTIIGAPVALILGLMWLAFLILGKYIAPLFIGWKIIKVNEKSDFWRFMASYAAGLVIYMIVGMVPFVGWLVRIIVILIMVGSMTFYENGLFKGLRKMKKV